MTCSPSRVAQQGGLVDCLVALAMGIDGGADGEVSAGNKKEEEIGMRRECMRALVGLAECQAARDTVSFQFSYILDSIQFDDFFFAWFVFCFKEKTAPDMMHNFNGV